MSREEFENLIDEKYVEIEKAFAEAKKELLEKYDEEHHNENDHILKNERYYYITNTGAINYTFFNGDLFDDARTSIGNFFRTKEAAEFEVERLKVIHELKKYAEKKPIWNGVNRHYYIQYHVEDDYMSSDFRHIYVYDTIYFSSLEDADKAIEAIGKDRLKKYYFRIGDEK